MAGVLPRKKNNICFDDRMTRREPQFFKESESPKNDQNNVAGHYCQLSTVMAQILICFSHNLMRNEGNNEDWIP